MPWGSLSRGAIGASILKRCLKQHGYPADVHYLNIRFAEQIGVERYMQIGGASAFFPEWFFAAPFFGARGMGLIETGWDELSGPAGQRVKREVLDVRFQ